MGKTFLQRCKSGCDRGVPGGQVQTLPHLVHQVALTLQTLFYPPLKGPPWFSIGFWFLTSGTLASPLSWPPWREWPSPRRRAAAWSPSWWRSVGLTQAFLGFGLPSKSLALTGTRRTVDQPPRGSTWCSTAMLMDQDPSTAVEWKWKQPNILQSKVEKWHCPRMWNVWFHPIMWFQSKLHWKDVSWICKILWLQRIMPGPRLHGHVI